MYCARVRQSVRRFYRASSYASAVLAVVIFVCASGRHTRAL